MMTAMPNTTKRRHRRRDGAASATRGSITRRSPWRLTSRSVSEVPKRSISERVTHAVSGSDGGREDGRDRQRRRLQAGDADARGEREQPDEDRLVQERQHEGGRRDDDDARRLGHPGHQQRHADGDQQHQGRGAQRSLRAAACPASRLQGTPRSCRPRSRRPSPRRCPWPAPAPGSPRPAAAATGR